MEEIIEQKLSDFHQDDHNFNDGTIEGGLLMDKSLKTFGAGRSILVDKNDNIIAGNKTALAALDAGINDALVVETDGKKLVVVQRTDIDLDSKEGRELAMADNQTSVVNLSWNKEEIDNVFDEDVKQEWGVDIPDSLYTIDDIDVFSGDNSSVDGDFFSIHITLPVSSREQVERYFREKGKEEVTQMIIDTCKEWEELYSE